MKPREFTRLTQEKEKFKILYKEKGGKQEKERVFISSPFLSFHHFSFDFLKKSCGNLCNLWLLFLCEFGI